MKLTPVFAGAAAGAVLVAGGLAAVELGTDSARASSQHQVSQADLDAANQRSQAAIRLAKDLQNNVGKYFQPAGQLIGAKPPPPPITQDRGTGDGGLPTGTIKDGAITDAKLSSGVKGQLNTIYTAAVLNTPGAEPSLVRGKGATAVTRTTGLGTGAFDVAFGTNDISQCTWTASVGTVQPGALTPVFAPFVTYTTLLNSTTLRVFTFTGAAGTLADAPFQVHVIC
jgi:hypothetical protein